MIAFAKLLFHAILEFQEDDGPALAGHVAFSALLGGVPFIILTANITAWILGDGQGQAAIDTLFQYAPPHIAQTLEPVLLDIFRGTSGSLLTASAFGALWFSSNAFEAIRTAFDRAYDMGASHSWLKGRLISIGCVLLGAVASMVLGVLIVLGPLVIQFAEGFLDVTVPFAANLARYGIGFVVFVIFILMLHLLLPRHRLSLRELWVGVLVSALLWVFAASCFSLYLSYTPTYISTYGTLAGVAITLVFLYISGMAIIYGAKVNALLAKRREMR